MKDTTIAVVIERLDNIRQELQNINIRLDKIDNRIGSSETRTMEIEKTLASHSTIIKIIASISGIAFAAVCGVIVKMVLGGQ